MVRPECIGTIVRAGVVNAGSLDMMRESRWERSLALETIVLFGNFFPVSR
jgi:hypothetical protein